MNEIVEKKMLQEAIEVSKRAHAPYSKYLVGCAILINDGQIVVGTNIENASYPVALCAERAAMAQVISRGFINKIEIVTVVTSSSPPGAPCGMCRQFLSEFLADDTPIILANHKGEITRVTMAELLPLAFNKNALS